ncbi:MAG: hypothetical protein Q7R52_03190 [archaeon]|nr:hypothetical protein [archaeon]
MKNKLLSLLIVVSFLLSISFSSAWYFNGSIWNENGIPLNNSLVNITMWAMGPNGPALAYGNYSQWVNGTSVNSTTAFFNITLPEDVTMMYKITIYTINSTTKKISHVGQALPQFPYMQIVNTSNVNFYLRRAGTINITLLNKTGGRDYFNYQIKDTSLGYDISSDFNMSTWEKVVYVPANRNYTIMVYPNKSLPLSFTWSNFTTTTADFTTLNTIYYNYTQGNYSAYNGTEKFLHKMFNATESYVRLSGFIQKSNSLWNETGVVVYLLESGDRIAVDYSALPYNMSGWLNNTGLNIIESDFGRNNASGWYNITLPVSTETTNYMLFASARNITGYYGGYRNITVTYGQAAINNFNFTMYPLLAGTGWGSNNNNITLANAMGGNPVNISSALWRFNLVNATNSTVGNLSANIEVKVNYSGYMDARAFTFVKNMQAGIGTFYLPLLNVSGVKEIDVYTMNYAPRRISEMTAGQLIGSSNITVKAFNPGSINGSLSTAQVTVTIYKSSAACDVPSPASSCLLQTSTTMATFNPLTSIIGGGPISFRMTGVGNISVHYVNVDMLASGPPDADFDTKSGVSETGSGFSATNRFGSGGPKIYDYILASMPYTESATTGLDDSNAIGFSINKLYDENWNQIWDTGLNGTNASTLASTYSYYGAKQDDWNTLMTPANCISDATLINSTYPCYVNTSTNNLWIRIPHFSGTNANMVGSLKAAAATTAAADTSSSSGSAATPSFWTGSVYIPTNDELTQGYTKSLEVKERVKVNVNGENHYVGIKELTATKVTIEISSDPVTVSLAVGEDAKVDVNNDNIYDIYVKLNAITNGKADITTKKINEEVPAGEGNVSTTGDITSGGTAGEQPSTTSTTNWQKWIIVAVVLIVIIALVVVFLTRNKKRRYMLYGY